MKATAQKIEKMMQAIEDMNAANEAYNEASRNLNPEYEKVTICGNEMELGTAAYISRIEALEQARKADKKTEASARRAVKAAADSLGVELKTDLAQRSAITGAAWSIKTRFERAMAVITEISRYDEYLKAN